MAHPFCTIGHGTRPVAEFVELLRSVEVTLLVDVRTVPRSRTNPQYNQDTLPASLHPFGIGYEHMAALGGLRGRARDVAPEVNAEDAGFGELTGFAVAHPHHCFRRHRPAAAFDAIREGRIRPSDRKQRLRIVIFAVHAAKSI